MKKEDRIIVQMPPNPIGITHPDRPVLYMKDGAPYCAVCGAGLTIPETVGVRLFDGPLFIVVCDYCRQLLDQLADEQETLKFSDSFNVNLNPYTINPNNPNN